MDHTLPHNEENPHGSRPVFSKPARAVAYFFSVVFHPLFVPAIATWYLIYWFPQFFSGVGAKEELLIWVRVAYNTIFFPALTVVLLKALGFLKSIQMPTQRDRIIPYVATNIFYFWAYLVFKNSETSPLILTAFLLGIFIASALALILNNYFKISMHGLGMGAFLGMVLVIIFSGFGFITFIPILLVFLATGIVCTSRLIVSDHTPFEIYTGLLIGIIAQFIAFIFVNMG